MKTPYILTANEIARFWSKVAKAGPDDCWLWTGWKNKEGYGRFDIDLVKPVVTHIVLELDGRPRPSARHLALHGDCSNPACCNPAHLRWGSARENSEDRERLQRGRHPKGTKHPMVKLTEDQVLYVRSSPLSQRALARELHVTQPLIGKIRRRVLWAHIP